MKFRLSSLITGLCGSCIAFLGFGCDRENGSEPALMYGTPTGSFEVKGKVVSEDGKSVPDATIRITLPDLDSGILSIATTTTDSKGNYDTGNDFAILSEVKVVCIPDGNEFEADSIVAPLKYKDKDSSDSWYIGHAEAPVDFKLKKKSENNNE